MINLTKLNFLKKSTFLGTAFALSTTAILQNHPLYAAPTPITVAVIKVKDNSNAPWFKPSYEDKLRTILSTELASAGHFTVLERDASTLKELKQEVKKFGLWKDEDQKALTRAKYYISAALSDFAEVSDEGSGGGIGFKGFAIGKKKSKKEYYVSFDLKVINVKTGAIAYSRSIEGSAKEESESSSMSGNVGGVSLGQSQQKTTKLPVTRAVRAAMVETAEYLDCVLYIKDECIAEYEAKDEKRKQSNDSLDMF